ncbi:uncharacterized protein CDV56_102636 [Aspergillus thermomutatus]|uniref:Fucose-specific lectin n=1 Tax=Aspergillus thermomutatus TaxID=41047 RepID=A0A397G110_ASPTH|nr:uncharacterized protein CDV56_102636 [Aspergillus thermomutatus]RHZ43504.1 hypothetical protein CDV56_102636 [Aspergillus thermomutatus]
MCRSVHIKINVHPEFIRILKVEPDLALDGNQVDVLPSVYSVSNNNTLQEEAHDSNTGWYTGQLTNSNIEVAAYSSLGAAYLAGTYTPTIRVYAQLTDNSIQEYGWDDDSNEWQAFHNLGQALPGTAIAVTSFTIPNQSIRVYFQDPQNNLIEMGHDSDSGWGQGSFSVANAIPRTALAVSTTEDDSIHVYYGGSNDRILERIHDANSGWYDGAFAQPSIPGSQVAAINWGTGSGLTICLYLQQGIDVSAVSEYQWENGSWSVKQAAIPPA